MMRKVCRPSVTARPAASSLRNGSRLRSEIPNPIPTRRAKAARVAAVPASPSSSPMAAKTKSVEALGIRSGRPNPSPAPERLPEAMAKRLWAIWYPLSA